MKSKLGRPFDVSNEPALRRLEVWLAIETARRRHKGKQTLSKSEAIRRIVASGGVTFLVGGDRDLLAAKVQEQGAEPSDNSKRLQLTRRKIGAFSKNLLGFIDDQNGPIFARSIICDAAILRTRYYEAQKLLGEDEELKAFYQSILETRLSG